MKITNKVNTHFKKNQTYTPISYSLFSIMKTCILSFLFFTSKVNSHEILLPDQRYESNGKLFGVVLSPGEPFYCYKGLCLSSDNNKHTCYTINDLGTSINIKLPRDVRKEGDPCDYMSIV